MDLRLCKQTFNVLLERRPIRRLSKNNVLTNVLRPDAPIINVPSKLTNILKTTAVNLNILNPKATPYTPDEREAYADIQVT